MYRKSQTYFNLLLLLSIWCGMCFNLVPFCQLQYDCVCLSLYFGLMTCHARCQIYLYIYIYTFLIYQIDLHLCRSNGNIDICALNACYFLVYMPKARIYQTHHDGYHYHSLSVSGCLWLTPTQASDHLESLPQGMSSWWVKGAKNQTSVT